MRSVAIAPVVAQDEPTRAAADSKLYVNMKGPGAGNPFWAAVEAGAKAEGHRLGVDLIVLAPPTESDVQRRSPRSRTLLLRGVDGIAIAPTDPEALGPALDDAIAQGVNIVYVDSNGNNEGVTFIGTDNQAGAAIAGQYLCDNLEEGSKVALLQGIISTTTGQLRATGGAEALKACGLDLVAELPADWDVQRGQAVTEDILTQHPDLAGIFASNDNMALGAIEALRLQGLIDQVTVIGFDANPNAADSILAGEMSATVAQNPFNMGYFGVESLIALINGETLDPVIDTGTVLVDESNAASSPPPK